MKCAGVWVGVVASLGVLSTDGSTLRAQAPSAGAPLVFEVASIKANKSGAPQVMINMQPGGRFTATNVPLRLLIRNAYRLQDFQIVNAPGWITSERYDVVAKAPESDHPLTPNEVQPMMQALLAERFKLAVHTETREMPVYALVLARSDGKLGPKLRPSDVDCQALIARGRGGPPPGPPPSGGPMPCGMRIGAGSLQANATIAQILGPLSQMLNRVVVDRTGLTGNYDFEMTWTPEQMAQGPGPDRPAGGANVPPGADPNGPSIFTAVQEQLGLKLEPSRGPIEVTVIDHVEMPEVD